MQDFRLFKDKQM